MDISADFGAELELCWFVTLGSQANLPHFIQNKTSIRPSSQNRPQFTQNLFILCKF